MIVGAEVLFFVNKRGQRDLAALLIAEKLALSCKHSSLSIKALPSVLVSFTSLF